MRHTHNACQGSVERTLVEEVPTKGGYTGLKHHERHAANHELIPLVARHAA